MHELPGDTAALYCAGALPDAEARSFEGRLAAGCPLCTSEYQACIAGAKALFDEITPVAPSPSVRDALLKRIDREHAAERERLEAQEAGNPATRAIPGVVVHRNHAFNWEPYGVPGIELCKLFEDKTRNLLTILIRMRAGAVAPVHPHGVDEECYVIEGDLHTFGTILRAGDYVRAPAGSEHTPSYTVGGCLLLVTTGIGDDIAA